MSGLSNTTQLFLNLRDNDTGEYKWTEMELSDDMPFPLIYSISDVKDITRRNSSYSKTIRIPGTKNNNTLLSHHFDVSLSAAIPIFNPNKKVRCFVLRDTLQVFEGSFQLRNIYSSDNRHPVYECVIYGENASFGQAIKEKYMNEILSFNQLDHFYTYENIVDSWDKDWTHGYYYPLINYGKFNSRFKMQETLRKGPRVTDFKPAIYVRWLWDQIFRDAGFTYESDFLKSEVFNRLVIPAGDLSQAGNNFWRYLNAFRATLSQDQELQAVSQIQRGVPNYLQVPTRITERIEYDDDTTLPNGDPSDFWSTTLFEYEEGSTPPTMPKPQTFYLNLHYTSYNYWTGRSRVSLWNADVIPFFNGLSGDFPQDRYNGCLRHRVELRVMRSLDAAGNPFPTSVPIDNAEPAYLGGEGTGSTQNRNRYVYLLSGADNWEVDDTSIPFGPGPGNNPASFPWQPFDGISEKNPYVFPAEAIVDIDASAYTGYVEWEGQLAITLDNSGPDKQILRPGEKLWVEISYETDNWTNNQLLGNETDPIPWTYLPQAGQETPIKIHSGSLIFNVPDDEVAEGGVISVKDTIPKKLKQIDFITSIVKMFNLFIETDKDDARNLFIEPRDDYYEKGVNRDWSDKLDLSKETKHDFISELQNKKIIYTYKEDEDLLNTVYTQRYDDIYGDFEYIIDNDFTTGEKKYELVFSPTPLANIFDMPSLIVPNITPVDLTDDDFEANLRILQRAPQNIQLPSTDYWNMYSEINQQTYSFSSYPYAGNLDHPTNATLDLNFGPVREVYYPSNLLTNNTLFNVYHRKMIEELTDRSSRLVTAYFYLNAQDVARLRFNDTIFVDQLNSGTGVYYRINKITYDPCRDGSYEVELMKILNKPAIYFPGVTSSETTTIPPFRKPPIGGDRPLEIGEYNTINGVSGVIGSNNIVDRVDGGLVVGDDNYMAPNVEGSFIVGKGNKIEQYGENSVIIGGENNKIGPSQKNAVLIGGDNGLLEESDRIKFNAIVLDATNYITAGRNEVLNRFPQSNPINYLTGGRDEVRNMGSYTVVNWIDGGGHRFR